VAVVAAISTPTNNLGGAGVISIIVAPVICWVSNSCGPQRSGLVDTWSCHQIWCRLGAPRMVGVTLPRVVGAARGARLHHHPGACAFQYTR
jgi:hypothetical protein